MLADKVVQHICWVWMFENLSLLVLAVVLSLSLSLSLKLTQAFEFVLKVSIYTILVG